MCRVFIKDPMISINMHILNLHWYNPGADIFASRAESAILLNMVRLPKWVNDFEKRKDHKETLVSLF